MEGLSFEKTCDEVFPQLLKIKEKLQDQDLKSNFVSLEFNQKTFEVETQNLCCIRSLEHTPLPETLKTTLKLYSPFFCGVQSQDAVCLFGHLAQSIDAKVACTNGQSQWISNTTNLKHVHRLRALTDGICVGSETVLRDDCRLNVRHVMGPNPIKFIFTSDPSQFKGTEKIFDGETKVFFLTYSKKQTESDFENQIFFSNLEELKSALLQEGVKSFFVEGGPKTFGFFHPWMRAFQVNISPMVIGKGLPSFEMESEPKHVDEVERFESFAANFNGDTLLHYQREVEL